MSKNNEKNLKSKKVYSLWSRIGKKVAVGAVGATLLIGSLLGFVGCAGSQTEKPNKPQSEPEQPPIVQTESITFDDFLTDYKDEAKAFVANYIEPSVIKEDVLSKECYINANKNDELDKVDFVYTYKLDETKRAIEIANVTLTDPVDLDEIADGTATLSTATLDINKKTAFEFDAKENFLKDELSYNLYNAADASSESLKLFVEVQSPVDNARFFDILEKNEKGFDIVELGALTFDDSDETLIKNLSDSSKYFGYDTLISYNFDGANLYNEEYKLEEFERQSEPEKPGPGSDVENQITDAEILESLSQNCADGIINKSIVGITINKSNISNEKWYVSSNNENKITGAEYTFEYKRSNTSSMYIVGSATFKTPVSREDLKDGKLGNVTYKNEYVLSYDPTIQETRKDLTNAILNACSDELTDGSIRILVDKGHDTSDSDLGESNRFQVVEISETAVKEYNVGIKYSTSDAGFINNIQNNRFKKYSERSYTMQGDLLKQEVETTKAASVSIPYKHDESENAVEV